MELLPCPFCGSKEIIIHQQHWHMIRKAHCEMCRSEATYDRENDIKTWNKRYSPWISVKDRLPENQQSIIATNGTKVSQCRFIDNDLSWCGGVGKKWFVGCFSGDYGGLRNSESYSYSEYIENVTHWMPLPLSPEEK